MKTISEFKGEYFFLSNFFVCDVMVDWNGVLRNARSVEHAYQASKAMNYQDYLDILDCLTPGDAKRLGQTIVLRSAWESAEFRLQVMTDLIKQKFGGRNLFLKHKLIETGDALIVEGNYWHDNFWGMCYCLTCIRKHAKKVKNHLGRIIMERRKILLDN